MPGLATKIGRLGQRLVGALRLPGPEAARRLGPEERAGQPGPFCLRRWEAAETNRLNRAHWQDVTGQSINLDLLTRLETLRTRSEYEAANNGLVQGIINTHAQDIVGSDGPTLQVQSDDTKWNEAAEGVWREWFYAPCPDPRISGAAWLKQAIHACWTAGDILAQLVTGTDQRGPVSLRVKPIHSRRLATPLDFLGDPGVFMGMRLSPEGAPRQYYVQNPSPLGVGQVSLGDYTPIPPDLMVHEFLREEEDQLRGYPWLTGGLNPAADLRDYDDQVLDAARQAADAGIVWHTNHPQATYIEVNETTSIERRQQWTGPPGWQPTQIKPEQPSTNYVDYRRERQSEIGRPVCMPLMTIRLDSARHNYSSARFDGQNYHRAVAGLQMWLSGSPHSTGMLSRLFRLVVDEARFSVEPLRRRPPGVTLTWRWSVPPHVDPTKEAQAERIGLENGTLPFAMACAARGYDEETVFQAEVRTNQLRESMGLPPLPPAMSYRSAPPASEEPGEKEDREEEQDREEEEEEADATV